MKQEGNYLYTCSDDQYIMIWDLENRKYINSQYENKMIDFY